MVDIKAVHMERLQDITIDDMLFEGVERLTGWDTDDVICSKWIELWNGINAKRGYGWDTNPWVWVVEFEPVNQGAVP